MTKGEGVVVRFAENADIGKLVSFFLKAYGANTVFQDKAFLSYYFGGIEGLSLPLSQSIIGVSPQGDIVSHYGGLPYQLDLKGTIFPITWRTNAYTLPEWRGKKIYNRLIDFGYKNSEFNASIGMPFDHLTYYDKLNFNVFNKRALSRYIYGIDTKTIEAALYLGKDPQLINKLIAIRGYKRNYSGSSNIQAITKKSFIDTDFNLVVNRSIVTTDRSKSFLKWRVFNNPYIDYKVFGVFENNLVLTYIVLREEILRPINIKVARIIDLFGDESRVEDLLNYTINHYSVQSISYLDFSVFGQLYEKELLLTGFSKLEDENASVLPMVSSPVEDRPNNEYLIFQSMPQTNIAQSLKESNVYFTRIDGDRDRLAKVDQLKR